MVAKQTKIYKTKQFQKFQPAKLIVDKIITYEAIPPNLNYYVQKFYREIIDSSPNAPIAEWKWDNTPSNWNSQLVSIFHDTIIDGIKYPNYYSYSLEDIGYNDDELLKAAQARLILSQINTKSTCEKEREVIAKLMKENKELKETVLKEKKEIKKRFGMVMTLTRAHEAAEAFMNDSIKHLKDLTLLKIKCRFLEDKNKELHERS